MSTDNTTDAVHDLRRHASDGAWDEAIAVLDRHWAEMLRSDPSAVRAALSEIPRAVIERHPRWASGLQYLDRMGSRESTVTFRDAPASGPRNLLDSLASATARAAGSRTRGALSAAARAAEGAREALDDASPEARAELSEALPELTYKWGMVWESAGELDAAAREYIDAHDYGLISRNTAVVALAAASLALVHALTVEIETYERTRSGEPGVAAALLAVARSVAAARLTSRAETALPTDAFDDASPWARGLVGAAAAG